MPAGEPIPVIPRPVSAESARRLRRSPSAPGARVSVAGSGAGEVAELLLAELASDCRRDLTVVHEPPAFGDIAIVIAEDEAPEDARVPRATACRSPPRASASAPRARPARSGACRRCASWSRSSAPSDPLTIEPVSIRDHPRYAYRGAMLDVARHFFTPAEVKRFIDAIVLLKVNHLHLHLTDDQGWRIHIERWPNLTAHGGSTGQRRQRAAASTRRTSSASSSPTRPSATSRRPRARHAGPHERRARLVSRAQPVRRRPGAVHRLEGRLQHAAGRRRDARGSSSTTWCGEVAALTPGPYLHIGGDECLSTSPAEFLRFIARATAIVADHGKIPAGWHEMGKSDALPDGTIGQYWDFLTPRGAAGRRDALVRAPGRLGHHVARRRRVPRHRLRGGRPPRPGLGRRPHEHPASRTSGTRRASCPGSATRTSSASRRRSGPRRSPPSRTSRRWCSRASPRSPRWPGRRRRPTPIRCESARDFDDFAPRLAALGAHWAAAGTNFRRVPEIAWREHASV